MTFKKGLAIAQKSPKAGVAQLHDGEEHGFGIYHARTMKPNKGVDSVSTSFFAGTGLCVHRLIHPFL